MIFILVPTFDRVKETKFFLESLNNSIKNNIKNNKIKKNEIMFFASGLVSAMLIHYFTLLFRSWF